jgi:hypothetical protein
MDQTPRKEHSMFEVLILVHSIQYVGIIDDAHVSTDDDIK